MTEDVCKTFMNNLEGKFYRLEGMTEEDEKELGKIDGLLNKKVSKNEEDPPKKMFE